MRTLMTTILRSVARGLIVWRSRILFCSPIRRRAHSLARVLMADVEILENRALLASTLVSDNAEAGLVYLTEAITPAVPATAFAPGDGGGWTTTMELPLFNPALGTLYQVETRFSSTVHVQFSVVHQSGAPYTGTAGFGGSVTAEGQVGSGIGAEMNFGTPKYDVGTLADWEQFTSPGYSTTISSERTYGPATQFLGPGSIELSAFAAPNLNSNGYQGFDVTFPYNPTALDVTASLSGEVIYIYTPAGPLPLAITALTPPAPVEGVSTGMATVATFTADNSLLGVNDFTATINWGDGNTSTATFANGGIAANADGSYSVVGANTYAEAATSRNFSVKVTDTAGQMQSSSQAISVADAPLTDTTPVTTIPETEGLAKTNIVLMTFSDAKPNAPTGDFSVSNVSWGGTLAGTAPTVSVVADLTYPGPGSRWNVVADTVTYAEMGSFPVSLTVHDVDGNDVSTSQTSFVVADAQLTDTTPLKTMHGTEGLANKNVVVMTFIDGNPFAKVGDFSGVNSFNSGGMLAGTLPNVSIVSDPTYVGPGSGWKVVASTLTYAEKGTYAISLALHDADGNNVSTSNTGFIVADAALTDTTSAAKINGTEGLANKNAVLMTFSDANHYASAADFKVSSLNWGGTLAGAPPTVKVVADPSYVGSGSGWKVVADTVTYAEKGTYTISLTVHDADGKDVSTSQTTLSLADAPLTDTTSARTINVMAGKATGYVVLATFTDGNPYATAADFSLSVNWGGAVSGTPGIFLLLVSRTAAGTNWAVVANVDFLIDGTYMAAVTINDSDGNSIVSKKTKFNVTG